MGESNGKRLFRFGVFEAEEDSGELRRQGTRVKVNAQAFQVLLVLLENPGQVVSRESIQQRLWPEGTFVDFDHGVNSAVNRIREALGDSAAQPRYVETLARRGYRFLAPVECIERSNGSLALTDPASASDRRFHLSDRIVANPGLSAPPVSPLMPERQVQGTPASGSTSILAAREELPQASYRLVRTLILLMQLMYLSFYISALANLPEIGELLSPLPVSPRAVLIVLIATAAVMIPVRLFLIAAVVFRPPAMQEKFLKMFPWLLFMDELWALSPFLLLHHINFGVALSCTAALVYAPFAQRSLMLMESRTSQNVVSKLP
ncbi:MAG TPA: winged helix-turn-helix domain-containing protein [candidate division Zixibacteria bacterium]|nr:winged helix-turn-helix domain-containing protein [candidate division Zixibacteria bacterium]